MYRLDEPYIAFVSARSQGQLPRAGFVSKKGWDLLHVLNNILMLAQCHILPSEVKESLLRLTGLSSKVASSSVIMVMVRVELRHGLGGVAKLDPA